jgi:hypothetical protein
VTLLLLQHDLKCIHIQPFITRGHRHLHHTRIAITDELNKTSNPYFWVAQHGFG